MVNNHPRTHGDDVGKYSKLFCESHCLLKLITIIFISFLHQVMFPNINRLLRIACTIPLTSADNERANSTLKLVKGYLRITMTTERLSGLGMMNIKLFYYEKPADFASEWRKSRFGGLERGGGGKVAAPFHRTPSAISAKNLNPPQRLTNQCSFISIFALILKQYNWSKMIQCSSFFKTNLKQMAHIHQPAAWPVPHACAQPYHPGRGSDGQQSRTSRPLVKGNEDAGYEGAMDSCFALIGAHQHGMSAPCFKFVFCVVGTYRKKHFLIAKRPQKKRRPSLSL